MRVVYDTKVLTGILFWREALGKLKQAVSNGRFQLVISPFIVNEVETVLHTKFGLTRQAAKSRSRLLERVAYVVNSEPIAPVSRDPDDDYILATAITGKAMYLVTLDKDLLILKEYESIKIVTPEVFNENHKPV